MVASFRIEPLLLESAAALALPDLYHEIFSAPPYSGINRDGLEERLRTQAGYAGFDGRVALAENGTLLGFAYGWTSVPGQWWHDRVRSWMPADQAEYWLQDCFELAEFGVRATFRGRGIGGALHDGLLVSQPHRTAILSVNALAEPARRLYLARGWRVIVEPVFFKAGKPAVLVLGRELPVKR